MIPAWSMALSEQAKKQAMDAVSHRETTVMMRAYQNNGIDASREAAFTYSDFPRPEHRPLSDEAKRQAMDAVSHRETTAQIRLVRDNGEIITPFTPSRDTERIASKIAEMHRSGENMDYMHKTITQDGFGREHV